MKVSRFVVIEISVATLQVWTMAPAISTSAAKESRFSGQDCLYCLPESWGHDEVILKTINYVEPFKSFYIMLSGHSDLDRRSRCILAVSWTFGQRQQRSPIRETMDEENGKKKEEKKQQQKHQTLLKMILKSSCNKGFNKFSKDKYMTTIFSYICSIHSFTRLWVNHFCKF